MAERLLEEALQRIKNASIRLAGCNTELKNEALKNIAKNLKKKSDKIFQENNIDIDQAVKNQISSPLIKRLKFDEKKLDLILKGIETLINFEDPVNKLLSKTLIDDDLILKKVTVPIGVIGIIFESRPDALIQIATLCLKSGNCSILKGGIEALHTNKILYEIIYNSICEVNEVFKDTIYLIETRTEVDEILKQDKYINLIIPRGSNAFVKYIMENSNIPVLGHAEGICHIYVDEDADIDMAIKVTVDAKTQYVAVCNAVETLLVHKNIAKTFLPLLKKEFDKKGVKIKGDPKVREIITAEEATLEDWGTEYLDYIISIKIVDNINEAIDHINKYGSGHTDSIITNNKNNAALFETLVDSSSVMVNCSTRFSDGYIYGLGAEVGISTNKIHARGPVGLEGLIIYKYILEGNGHIVADYYEGKKTFKHKKIL